MPRGAPQSRDTGMCRMGGVAAGLMLCIASVSRAQSRGDIAIGSGDGDGERGDLHDSGWKPSLENNKEATEYHLDVVCAEDSATADIIAPDNKEDMELQFWNNIGQNQSVPIDWESQDGGSGSGVGDIFLVNCGNEYGPCNHPRETQQTLTPLYPFHQYTFCLKNVSSEDSIICTKCNTKEAVPLKNPSVLPVESGLDFVSARWLQLDEEQIGGPDLTYKLVLESTNANMRTQEKITGGTSSTFSNLAPGSNFTLSISAQNSVGESKASKATTHVSTQELVAPQVKAVTQEWRNHTLVSTVAWQLAPSMANLCGDNCTTAIQLWQLNGEEFLRVGEDVLTKQMEKTFELPDGFGPWEGMTRDTHLTLKTLYSSFSSSATQPTRIFGPVTVPLVQPNVTQTVVGHTFIDLHWTQLSREQQGAPGIFYMATIINLQNVERIEGRTRNTSYSFTSLAPATKYRVFVSSGNDEGMCLEFAGMQLTTRQLLPPHSVAVSHERTNHGVVATVTWQNHRNITQWPNTTIQLATPINQQKTLLHKYQIHNQTEMKFNLTEKINEETLLTLKTSIGQYESGETEAVELFEGITVPLANPNISITEVGLTSISVEWSPLPRRLHGAPGLNYTLRCEPCKDEGKEVFASNTSLTLNHLTPGREYNISVTAENMIGQSNGPVYSQVVKTKVLLTPSHVTVSKEWVNQSLVAVIQWQNQEQEDDMIEWSANDQKLEDDIQGLFRTHIHLWNLESQQKILMDNQALLPDQAEKRFILTGELANAFFSLKAFYREHQSNETELFKLFNGVSVPSNQPKVYIGDIGPTFILIKWPQFSRQQWGAPGLQFRVKCNGSGKQFEVLTSNNSQLISDLIPGEEYSISVTSENILGESDEAAIAQMVKTESLLPPINIMVEQGEEDTTLVSWRISHNVSAGCSEAGVYVDLWNQHQGDYIIVESHQVDSNQLEMKLRVGGDLDYGTMLSMKSYCDHYNSSRSQRFSLFDAPDLAPPVNITVSHIWNNNILTANIDWQFPESENLEKNEDKGGVILELWSTNGTHYSLVNNYTSSYNQTQLSFNMSEELNQRAMFRMMTYYQNHQSTATNLTSLFYDVSQEASTALLEKLGLISGVSILVFAVLTLLACHLLTNQKKMSYNTNSAVGYDNCNNTQLRSFTAADQSEGITPVKETSDGGYGSLRGSLGSVSVEGDDMWFLYSGMDEDGSFIVSYSHLQDTDNLEWREASAGEQASAGDQASAGEQPLL